MSETVYVVLDHGYSAGEWSSVRKVFQSKEDAEAYRDDVSGPFHSVTVSRSTLQ